MKLVVVSLVVIAIQSLPDSNAVVEVVNSERERLGIQPLQRSDGLDKLVQAVYLLNEFPPNSSFSLEKQKAAILFKDACTYFIGGCGDKSGFDMIKSVGVKFIEAGLAKDEEAKLVFEKNKHAFLSRGPYACEPISAVAGARVMNKLYLALFPSHVMNHSFTTFRPVDFCPDKLVEGMSAYWVPDSFSGFRSIYNGINLDRTTKELPPLMFSAPLSANPAIESKSLGCESSTDPACMPSNPNYSPNHKTWTYSFPNNLPVPNILPSLNQKLAQVPRLLSSSDDERHHWHAIGVSNSTNQLQVYIAMSQSTNPKPMVKLCRRSTRLYLRKS